MPPKPTGSIGGRFAAEPDHSFDVPLEHGLSLYLSMPAAELQRGAPFAVSVRVLNSGAALCTAYGANAPVLCLTGNIMSHLIGQGRGQLHELSDQLALLRGLTKWAERINHPSEAGTVMAQAFQQLRSGRVRPVAVETPWDVFGQRAAVRAVEMLAPLPPPLPDPDSVQAAAQLVAAARKPLIMVGAGAVHAGDEILELAQRLQAPVTAHRSGKGIVGEHLPYGLSMGAAYDWWQDCDLLIGIGSRLELQHMRWRWMPPGLKTLRIDIDPTQLNLTDVAWRLDQIDNLSASVDTTGKLRIAADSGYGVDFSPRLDPNPAVAGTFGGAAPSMSSSASGPYDLSTQTFPVTFVVQNGTTASPRSTNVTLDATDFANPAAASTDELVAAINADLGGNATASNVNGRLVITSTSSGADAQLAFNNVAGGTAVSALGLPTTVAMGQSSAVDVRVSGAYTGSGRVAPYETTDATVGYVGSNIAHRSRVRQSPAIGFANASTITGVQAVRSTRVAGCR
jgi:hypothetical protein